MKVSQVRRQLIKVTIELESEKEFECLDYLLWANVRANGDSIRLGRLSRSSIKLTDEDVKVFQRSLHRLLMEDDC